MEKYGTPEVPEWLQGQAPTITLNGCKYYYEDSIRLELRSVVDPDDRIVLRS
jgi:hypothetical protein